MPIVHVQAVELQHGVHLLFDGLSDRLDAEYLDSKKKKERCDI